MASTRQLILDHLRRRFPATAAELSRALGLTAANIRHHLSILVEEGAVAEYSHQATAGRGRPARLYALARQAYSHNLDSLSAALLEASITSQPDSSHEHALRVLAQRLATLAIPPEQQSTLTRRLNQAVNGLTRMNYEARWEARKRAPHIIFGHCPYAAILEEHPELCQMDTYLLETLLAIPVAHADKLKQDQAGRTYCRFIAQIGEH